MSHRTKLAVLIFCAVASAVAQTTTGEIIGTITDPSGSPVPSVKITLVQAGTQQQLSTTSGPEGDYLFARLLPREYSLVAEASSFKRHTVSSIQLLTGQRARLDIRLEIGDVSQSVQVQGGVVLMETDTSDLGQVIDERRIRDLPLNGRTFFQLASLVAGTGTFGTGSALLGRSELGLAIGGQKGDSNSFLLDGVETQSARFGTASLRPSVDAIQEFKLQRSSFSAEFGQNQAIVNTTIKSGTNDFHGTVFEFLRNNRSTREISSKDPSVRHSVRTISALAWAGLCAVNRLSSLRTMKAFDSACRSRETPSSQLRRSWMETSATIQPGRPSPDAWSMR